MKRTVEMALWGGEEQVFAGSLGYVDRNIGNIESGQLKEKAAKVSAYLNLDNGAGQIRGIYAMGNDRAMPIFEKFLMPFPGNANVTIQYANQTDHELFDRLNIPAFQFIQDPLDYMTAIHHTNMDVYEYVNQVDIAENAVIMAYLIYQIANHESLIPRKINNSPAPSKIGNTTISIAGYPDAKQINIIGTFNNWNLFGTNLYKTQNGWECKLDLEPGEYLYKFYIDGDFIADPTTAKADLRKDGKGHAGLTLLKVTSN